MPDSCGMMGGRKHTRRYWKTHGIGKLKKGQLMGYHATDRSTTRHRKLRKTVRKYGALSTFRKLNAIATLSKNTTPKSKTFKADRNWIKKTFMK
jgi:hypothetical protein